MTCFGSHKHDSRVPVFRRCKCDWKSSCGLLRIIQRFTFTDVETQFQTVVPGLADFSAVTSPPSPPPLDIKVRSQRRKEKVMCHVLKKKVDTVRARRPMTCTNVTLMWKMLTASMSTCQVNCNKSIEMNLILLLLQYSEGSESSPLCYKGENTKGSA